MLASSKKIFISYSRDDRPWIASYLKCVLNAAEVDFLIDEEDFEIGPLIEHSIINAMEQCPYTLFVMTPNWVKGKWTHYESLVALNHVQQSLGRQILPIKLRKCEVPAHIADRLYLDLSNPLEWDRGMAKLLKQIGVADEYIAVALNRVAKKTLLVLVELMRDPEILNAITKLRGLFVEVQHGNRQLMEYKTLHDQMHRIQQTLGQFEQHVQDANNPNWAAVLSAFSPLRSSLGNLIGYAEAIKAEGVDVTFIRFFKPLLDDFDQAYQGRDAKLLDNLVRELSRRLDQYLPRLHERILDYLQGKKLHAMADSLQVVYETAIGPDPELKYDEATEALLQEFRSGIDALVELDMEIRTLVQEHCILQDAEACFQHMVRPGCHSLDEIRFQWKRAGRWVGELKQSKRDERWIDELKQSKRYESWTRKLKKSEHYGRRIGELEKSERYGKLLDSYARWSDKLTDETCIRDSVYEDCVHLLYQEFAHETRVAFNMLDFDLLTLCRKLQPHNDLLQQILNRMQSDDWSNA